MQPIHPFQIMCKPVSGICNLDCKYCYYTMKPELLYSGNDKFMMSPEVRESYVRQYMECLPMQCEFGWQGGEPTLAGLDFYKEIVALQQKYKRPGQQFTNCLQTNGTRLDDEWCEFLAENNFLVGISLDGPPQWHDKFRLDRAGQPTFHKAWRGVELCRKYGVEFNVLVTLNSVNAPHAGDIYRYFVNKGIDFLQFIPILERHPDGRPTDYSCTGEQFGDFMLQVFDIWSRRDVGKVSERLIDSIMHVMVTGRSTMCCYSQQCGNAHVLEWNGDLYACDHFVFEKWKIGNIMETPLAELVRDPKLQEFMKLKTDLPETCRDCEFLKYCWGGCPKHHRPEIGTDPKRYNHYCVGLKKFFKVAVPVLEKMAEYVRRGEAPPMVGQEPPQPMPQPAAGRSFVPSRQNAQALRSNGVPTRSNAPRAASRPTAAPTPTTPTGPVGRNEPCPCGSGLKYKKCCGRK